MTGFSSPEFWSSLTGPGFAVLAAVAFVWALVTGRIVIGSQFKAEKARADRYDEDNRKLVETVISNTAASEATKELVTSFQKQLNDLAGGSVK